LIKIFEENFGVGLDDCGFVAQFDDGGGAHEFIGEGSGIDG